MSVFFYLSFLFFCYRYGDHRDLHSFPTRRSSDLLLADRSVQRGVARMDAGHILPGRIRRRDLGDDLIKMEGGRIDDPRAGRDRKSTRLNSSHSSISYAVFCLKKKKKNKKT